MKKPTSFLRYRDYVQACRDENVTPMTRTEWNYKCMKETFDE